MGGFIALAIGGRVTFDRGELTGAIGDSVTVIPLVVALATLTDVSLPHVLIGFGAFQLVWGVVYGLPLSVEPMKALAALPSPGRSRTPNSRWRAWHSASSSLLSASRRRSAKSTGGSADW